MSSALSLSKVLKSRAGWYRGDFHAHTNFSDGHYAPPDLVDVARAAGLDFFAITDHNTIGAFPEFGQVSDLVIIPGIEVTMDHGHFNVFGLDGQLDWLPDVYVWPAALPHLTGKYSTTTRLMQQTSAQGLLNSINHPLLPPWDWLEPATDLRHVQCLEIWNDPSWPDNKWANPRAVKLWTEWLNEGYRITAIGGSDYHVPVPKPGLHKPAECLGLPSTYVYAEALSGAAILAGLRQRRAYVSMGPRVTFQARLNGKIHEMGMDLGTQQGEISFTATVINASPGTHAQILHNGQVVAELLIRQEQTILQHTAQANPIRSDWYRLDVYDQAGLALVVTNPIFAGPRKKPGRYTFGEFVSLSPNQDPDEDNSLAA